VTRLEQRFPVAWRQWQAVVELVRFLLSASHVRTSRQHASGHATGHAIG
jgi:hypothetical protein